VMYCSFYLGSGRGYNSRSNDKDASNVRYPRHCYQEFVSTVSREGCEQHSKVDRPALRRNIVL